MMAKNNFAWFNEAMSKGELAPLRPCPFCLGDPVIRGGYNGSLHNASIKCSICRAEGATFAEETIEAAERKAIIAWNLRRAEL